MDEVDLQKLQQQDQEAFAALVRAHHRSLTALAATLVASSDVDEVVQNTWVKAYGAIQKFEGRSTLRTWLTRILVNEAKMHHRSQYRRLAVIELGEDALEGRFNDNGRWQQPPGRWSSDDPEALLMEQDMADCLEKTFAEMPENQRAMIEMRDVQLMSFDDICNDLNVSASNARVLLHRARTAVYALVDHYQETGEC